MLRFLTTALYELSRRIRGAQTAGTLEALLATRTGIPTLIDDSLLRMPDLYFEAGDHRDLVHVSGCAFRALLSGSAHGAIARPH